MNNNALKFIKERLDLIENNHWNTFYFQLNKDESLNTGEVTKILIDVGINPLDYLEAVPDYYLFNTNINKFVFTERSEDLVEIGFNAFGRCYNLKEVDFTHTSLNYIDALAFEDCLDLKTIRLPGTLKNIEEDAFLRCFNLRDIYINCNYKDLYSNFPIHSLNLKGSRIIFKDKILQ